MSESTKEPVKVHSIPDSARIGRRGGVRPGAPWKVKEAAEYLSITPRYLRKLIRTGAVSSILVGTVRMVADSEVRRLSDRGTGKP